MDTETKGDLPKLEYVSLTERFVQLEGGLRLPITQVFCDDEELLFEEIDAELHPALRLIAGPDDEGYWYNLNLDLANVIGDDSVLQ